MIFIIFGAPGAGKGTQVEKLKMVYDCSVIGTGEILRSEVNAKTEVGKQIEKLMAEGLLVDDALLLKVVQSALSKVKNRIVLLDGYPRNLNQARSLDSICSVSGLLHIDVSEEELVKRIAGRRICSCCSKVFNIYSDFKNEVSSHCSFCGTMLSSRPDDQPEKVKTRISIYNELTTPVLSHYKELGVYYRVDGSEKPEKVESQLVDIIEKKIN